MPPEVSRGAAGLPASITLALPEPIDLSASLDVFRRPGDDLIDRFDGHTLVRTAPDRDRFTPYRTSIASGLHRFIELEMPSAEHERSVAAAAGGLFVYSDGDWPRLLAEDSVLNHLDALHPGIRPVLQHDLFTALVRSISAQQINLRWAATIRARLAERYGDRHEIGDDYVYSLNVERLAAADPADIRALQFTTRKAESIVSLASELAAGRLSLEMLLSLSDDDDVVAKLMPLRGIGLWSAEWILCRTLGRPRVVAGDLGVRKAVGRAYLDGALPSERQVRELTAQWGPSAAVAQGLVLHAHAIGTTLTAESA